MIRASGITKSFGSLQVLRGVDFSVEKSEIVSIVGASGAGKSTLLQIVGTLLRPDSGTLLIDGCNPFDFNEKRLAQFRNSTLGFVFQAHRLLGEFSAVENVMIPAMIAGQSTSRARLRAMELLDRVGLSQRAEHKPSELSGGEAQRVAIARALVNSPSVLLADEPSGNLDSKTKQEIHRLFFDIRDTLSQTVVIVTHDESLAQMCDRCLNMMDGQFL